MDNVVGPVFAVFNQGVDNVSVEARNGASVPEPTTLALLGLGIAGVGFNRRKQLI